jgi:UDP-glucose 4-epimerase
MKRVLVTGAGGFVGRAIMASLLWRGIEVIAVDTAFDADFVQRWDGWKIDWMEANAAVLPPFSVDAVVHAAALTASPEEAKHSPEANLSANLEPTLRILEWGAVHAWRVMLISSGAVFQGTTSSVLTETSPISPLGTYAIAKSTTEQIAETWKTLFGRDVVCVRLSSIYGGDEVERRSRPRLSVVARYTRQALETGRIIVHYPDAARDWTYAPDVGEAIYVLLNTQCLNHSLYNIASEQVRTPLQIAQAIQGALPSVSIDVYGGDEPNYARPLPRGVLSHRRLTDEVGFRAWTPFEQGIAQTVEAARQRYEAAS